MSVGEFSLPFQEMSGHSLECKTGKRQRRKKNPLGPREGGGIVGWDFFLSVGEKNLGGKKKCQRSGMTGLDLVEMVTFVAVTPKVLGSSPAGTSI